MVLDPLSAFSVACNVIQVIETGCKILSTASDYRKAADGALLEQKELRGIARTLENLSEGLQTSLSASTKSNQTSPEENRLIDANNACLDISKVFINLLDRLKVKNKYATIESLRMSIKARWYKDRIDTMKQALSEARNNLNIAFLLYMHSEQVLASQQIDGKITQSTFQVEHNILNAVNSSSTSTQDVIQKLAERLKETYLDSDEKMASGFMSIHQNALNDILVQIRMALNSSDQLEPSQLKERMFKATQNILTSLHFQQVNDRQDQVQTAYSSTYKWMLQPLDEKWQRWTCFSTWLESLDPQSQLYWIHGKPGSGKSTLMKFLDKNISADDHMSSWAQGLPVLKAVWFFWASGSILQKSLGGLYRALLLQLFEQRLDIISSVVSARKWRAAEVLATGDSLTWTDAELRATFEDLVDKLRMDTKMLLLIDGLDEFEGSNEEQDCLVHLLHDLALLKNIKICVSSRPLNIFKEALQQYPQLRLEDLTRSDIDLVVASQLEHNSRFCSLRQSHSDESKALIAAIIGKASGVFLWVRLVLRDLLRALRDGDSMRQLQRRLDLIPLDLDKYFLQIIDSIEPEYRREASTMLQIALYEEAEFVSVRSMFLSDLCFVEGLYEDDAVATWPSLDSLPLLYRQEMHLRLDSAYRKLNSRCVGLLECVRGGYWYGLHGAGVEVENPLTMDARLIAWNEGDDVTFGSIVSHSHQLSPLHHTRIELFHRTLRDFLLTPNMQEHLHYYTHGPLNIRAMLYNAWAKHFIFLIQAGNSNEFTVSLASHILSALSADRHTRMSANVASRIENAMTLLANDVRSSTEAWYIGRSLERWHVEESNFLTLAIDFRLSSYVVPRLTTMAIKDKAGRPILDYILRPRFGKDSGLSIGNRFPDAELLQKVLESGGDPNEKIGTGPNAQASVWGLFLCSYRDMLLNGDIDDEENLACFDALHILVDAGANVFLIYTELSMPQQNDCYLDKVINDVPIPRDVQFRQRWPTLTALNQKSSAEAFGGIYPVSDVFECFRTYFGSSIDGLILLSKRKEVEHPGFVHGTNET